MSKPIIREPKMNGTEQAYSNTLTLLRLAGEVLDFKFQCITFNYAHKATYTPDFFVTYPDYFEVIEIKGAKLSKAKTKVIPYCKEDDIIKIKIVAALFPHFKFRMAFPYKGEWCYRDFSSERVPR